jgi:hypothetical protein
VIDDEASDDEGSEEGVGDDEASLTNNPDRHLPVVTDFNLQGFKDGTTPPAIVEDEEDHIKDPLRNA